MCKTIKHKVKFRASTDVVYTLLADSAARSAATGRHADISPQVGGTFSTDDGRVTGINVDMVPGKRLVQAWRRTDFPEGIYSMAAFTFTPTSDGGTELVLTHRGVPKALLDDMEEHWRRGYWGPMKAFLAAESSVSRGTTGRGQPTTRESHR